MSTSGGQGSVSEQVARRREDKLHAGFCIALAQDFEQATRYVDFSTSNYGTFSVEFARLLLDAGSEVENVAKLIWRRDDPAGFAAVRRPTIREWLPVLHQRFPDLQSCCIRVFQEVIDPPWSYGLAAGSQKPGWWDAYNRVKHDRYASFKEANLGNVVNAIGGLFLLGAATFDYQIFGVAQQRVFDTV